MGKSFATAQNLLWWISRWLRLTGDYQLPPVEPLLPPPLSLLPPLLLLLLLAAAASAAV